MYDFISSALSHLASLLVFVQIQKLGGNGARKSIWPCLDAIFLLTIFTGWGGGGRGWPPGNPTEIFLAKYFCGNI